MGRNLLKRVLAFAVVAGYIASLVFAVNAIAASNIFKVESAEITELSSTAEGNVTVIDDANISSDITFKTVGDEAKLKITLKNSDSKEHTIEAITDNNDSSNIVYEYDDYNNLSVAAGESFDFLVTIKYQTAVANVNDRVQTANVKFAIKFLGVEEQDIIPFVPNTGAGLAAPKNEAAIKSSVITLIISTAGVIVCAVIIAKNHKKAAKVVAVFVALAAATTIATAVKAATIEINNITVTVDYAMYDKLVVTYEDSEGNTHEAIVDYNGKVNLEDQSKTGYTFVGWTYENGDPFDPNAAITEDIIIKPVFRKNNYTVSFNGNQGTGEMADLAMTYDEEKALTENAFTFAGHSFTGWNTQADGEGDSYTDKQSVKNLIATDAGSITLYAQWQANTYSIKFDANAPESTTVTGEMADLEMTYGTPKKLTNNAFAIVGYKFASWNTQADGNGETIHNGAQVNNLAESGSVTLYAIWEEKVYVCREATELHDEPCKNSGTGGCANNGGYSQNETITYGSLVDENSPKPGDAYDCDVNYDGVYDDETERFYYMHTLEGNAVMFYYNNMINEDKKYNTVLDYFPTTSTWDNPGLTEFDNGLVARRPTKDDLSKGCGNIDVMQKNSLLNCIYTLENTSFGNTANSRRSTYMLERDSENTSTYYRAHKNYRDVVTGDSNLNGSPRPVVEIPVNLVQGLDDGSSEEVTDDVVSFDITSDAVKNYYANVGTWNINEESFLLAMKNNYDSNSCKSTPVNPQTSSDFPTEFRYATTGTVSCDKPKSYDTKTTDIKVYLSDETTKAKGAEATYVSVSDRTLTNLIPGTTYYWESTTNSNVHGFVKATGDRRLIDLPTARNVRDLGGIKGANGKTIEYGRIMRGEKLDANDAVALLKLGINKEYDVRSDASGSHLPTGYEQHAMTNYDIIDEGNYAPVRNALTSLMNDIVAGNNVYIHCTHGSDRTGTLVYLAEALLGVSDEDRDRDYDLTALSGRADRTRYYDHNDQSSGSFSSTRKYVYMTTELPDEAAVREWYFRGSSDRTADEQLIENFKNAILK